MIPRRRHEEKMIGASNNFNTQSLRSPTRYKEISLVSNQFPFDINRNIDNKQDAAKLPSFGHEKETAVSKNKRLMRKVDNEHFDQEIKPERHNKRQLKFTESTPRNPRTDGARCYKPEQVVAMLRDRAISGSLIPLLRNWLLSSKKELQLKGIKSGVERLGVDMDDEDIEKLWELLKDNETGVCDVSSAVKNVENISIGEVTYPKAAQRPHTDEQGNFVEPHDRIKMSRSAGIFNNPNGTRRSVQEVAFRVFHTLREKYSRMKTATEMIKAWDLERSGIITTRETRAILKHMNLELSEEEHYALLEFIFKASQLDITDNDCDDALLETLEEPDGPSKAITCMELIKGLTGFVPDDFEDSLLPLSPEKNLDSSPAHRLSEQESLKAIKLFRERCNLKFRTHHEAWHFFEARSKTHDSRSEISPDDFSNCIKQLLPDITELSLECIVQNTTGDRGVVQFKTLTTLLGRKDLDRLPMERNPAWPGSHTIGY